MALVTLSGKIDIIPFKLSEIEIKNKSKNELINLYNALLKQHEQLIASYNSLYLEYKKEITNNNILTKQLGLQIQTIEDLRNQIIQLQKDNESLKELILLQNNKINEQDNRINDLTNEIAILKYANDKQMEKLLYCKYIMAIQDINAKDKLESKIPILKNLRSHRNDVSHYLLATFTTNEIDQCIFVLLDKLINMPSNIKTKFDKLYPGMIDSLKTEIKQPNIILSNSDEEYINEWWEV